MKKKLSILVLFVLATAMLLASCKAGVPAYNIELDPATGKGTAKFTVAVPKNDVPETGNNFDKESEQGYIKSPQALLDLFKSKAPAGYTVAMTDEAKMVDVDGEQKDQGNFVYAISFSFTGIEDYNAKLLKLVGQKSFDKINADYKKEEDKVKKATLTYTKKGDKYEAAFTEDVRTIDVVSEWAVQVMLNDTTGVFRKGLMGNDPGSVAEFSNMINLDGAKCVYKIKYAGQEEEFARISNGEAITMKATVDAIPEGNTAPTTPKTGEKESAAKIVIPIALAVALLALIAGAITRSKSNKNTNI